MARRIGRVAASRRRKDGMTTTAPETVRAPGRPQDSALDAAILKATLRLLGEVGYEGLSIEEVARRAGTAKTSVYRRWPTKDALTLVAVQHYVRGLAHRSGPEPSADAGSLRADLLAHARGLAAVLTRERAAVFAGLLLAIRSNPALGTMLRQELVDTEIAVVTRIVERAIARGEIAAGKPSPLLMHVLPGVLFTRLFILDRPLDDRFIAELIDDVLVPLIGQRRRSNRTRLAVDAGL
jgi:AcrR family transcriptional regulator